jgi:hypothetical protein
MVAAVAVPVGNASCSTFTSWRLIGMATNTPSAATDANHSTSGAMPGMEPVSSSSEPSAAMLPPPVM